MGNQPSGEQQPHDEQQQQQQSNQNNNQPEQQQTTTTEQVTTTEQTAQEQTTQQQDQQQTTQAPTECAPEVKKKHGKDKKDKKDKQLLTPEEIAEMNEQERLCAQCDRQCEVLEYPENVKSKIDHEMMLYGSGNANRWHIVITSGMHASKWKPHVADDGNMADLVGKAAAKHQVKPRVSLCTKAPESGCHFEDATDLLIFPEHVKYTNVLKEQIDQVLDYHFNTIAPRHQAYLRLLDDAATAATTTTTEDGTTTPTDITIPTPVYTEEQLAELEKEEIKAITLSPQTTSQYVQPYDKVQFGVGVAFTAPRDLEEDAYVLLCGHKTRDARCGVVAPILKEQFDIVLEKLCPEKVTKFDIDLITHTGGHAVAGNCIIHAKQPKHFYAFYGRVFPEHVENIVTKTLLAGEIIKPLTRASHNDLW